MHKKLYIEMLYKRIMKVYKNNNNYLKTYMRVDRLYEVNKLTTQLYDNDVLRDVTTGYNVHFFFSRCEIVEGCTKSCVLRKQ